MMNAQNRETRSSAIHAEEDTLTPLEKFFGFGETRKKREQPQADRSVRRAPEPENGKQSALERVFGAQFPSLNITENTADVRVVLDVEGLDANNINIEVAEDWMAINGWMETVVRDEARPRSIERTFRAFRREVTLPSQVREDDVEASYDGKRLTVVAPKAAPTGQNRIRVEKLPPTRGTK